MSPALAIQRNVSFAVISILALLVLATPGAALAQHQHGLGTPHVAGEQSYHLGSLTISSPWSRATVPNAPVAGAYLRIANRGQQPDRLIAADFDGAGHVEIHESTEENGIARMRRLEPGLLIPAGATVDLKPGGYHLMLMQLERGLTEGQKRKATLVFEQAGRLEVEFAVRSIGAGSASHANHPKQ